MDDARLHAHSLAEAFMYLGVTPCARCHKGPLACDEKISADDGRLITMQGQCAQCANRFEFIFTLPINDAPQDRDDLYPVLNPTEEPSHILDVGQWITLFRVILEAADKEEKKIEARRLGYEAAQCLDEALKFYTDNELPPESAAFTPESRDRLRDHPELFARERLLDLRSKLPKTTTMQNAITRDQRPKPWWKFW